MRRMEDGKSRSIEDGELVSKLIIVNGINEASKMHHILNKSVMLVEVGSIL